MADPQLATLRLDGGPDALQALMTFVESSAEAFDLPKDVSYAYQLAIEEIVTNLMKYGYGARGQGPIEVRCQCWPGKVEILVRDQSPPYDIRHAPQPDLDLPLPDRMPGGLGIYLVLRLMDEVVYLPDEQGWNTLRLSKSWAPSPNADPQPHSPS